MSSSASSGSAATGASAPITQHGELGCTLCRKKTGEVVSKVCMACGLPVHHSCAQLVAARECDLEFGFPPPLVFCSRRCFDTNTSAPGLFGTPEVDVDVPAPVSTPAANAGTASDRRRWSAHVPNEVTAALTLKIGDVRRTSRKHLSITTFRFLLSEGFDVLRAKVNSRTAKELQAAHHDPHVREDPAIYIRPGVHSKQSDLVELSEKNFETRIRKTYRNFLKRKATQAATGANEQFECDIFVYVKKETPALRLRRPATLVSGGEGASASGGGGSGPGGGRSAAAGLSSQGYAPHYSVNPGEYSDTGSITVNDGAVSSAIDSTLHHLVRTDNGTSSFVGMKRRLASAVEGETPIGENGSSLHDGGGAYKNVRIVLNGSIVSVQVNIQDVLSAIGLSPSVIAGLLLQANDDGGNANASNTSAPESMQC